MNSEKYELNNEEIKLLSYEFSDSYIYVLFDVLQESLNRINKYFILLSKNIVNKNSYLKPEKLVTVKSYSEKIKHLEDFFIQNLNVIIQLIKVKKNIQNNPKIYILLSREDRNIFLNKIKERKELIDKYREYIDELEKLQETVKNSYEKMITSNSFFEEN